MQIKESGQLNYGPPEKPEVENPVKVAMDIPLYYYTERGPVSWNHSVFCAESFAKTVLQVINDFFLERKWGLVHIGFYNPRQARKRDGSLIEPMRWSNHAFGEAMDLKGVVTEDGLFYGIDPVAEPSSIVTKEFVKEIWQRCASAVEGIGRRPEIVHEGGWLHIGLWPKER